jgi:localization factor PodJL
MSLGEWLNTMIVDRAETTDEPSDLNSVARRLESLTQKLDAASRRGTETAIPRGHSGGDSTEIVRALDAVARLAELSERRSAAAIEAIERMSAGRAAEPRLSSPPLAPSIVADPGRSSAHAQLEEIARSIRGITDGPLPAPEPAAIPRRKGFSRDIESAVAEIAARQRALDLPPAKPIATPARQPARQTDFGPLEERLDSLSRRMDAILNAQLPRESGRDSGKIAAEISRLSQQIDTIARPSGDGLEREIRTLATRIEAMRAELGQREHVSAGRAIAEVRADLAEINQRIGSLAPRQSVETLEFEIHSLGERLADVRAQGIPAEGLEWLVAEFERTVAGLTPAEGIAEEVRALSRKLESARLYGLDAADAGQLIDETRAIRGMLAETASRASVEALADQVATLGDRIDALASQRPAPQGEQLAAALEARIEQITARIESAARQAAPVAPAASNPELEEALRRLADKLEGSTTSASDPKALAEIERHIVALAAKIDATDQRFTQLGTIERGLSDLFVQMEEMRASAIDAAERAARGAVAGRGSPDVEALKREIEDLRHGQAATDQRAQGAVDAVQETLERVARRIAEIETAPGAPAAPAAAPAVEPDAPVARAVRIAPRVDDRVQSPAQAAATQKDVVEAPAATRIPAAAAPRPTSQVDQPLEPGSGAPRLRPPAPGAGQAASKGDFIAAARRAAQAAAEASQSSRPSAKDAGDQAPKASLFSRLRGGKAQAAEPVVEAEPVPAKGRKARDAAPPIVAGPAIISLGVEPAEAGPTLGDKLAANRKTIVMGIGAALLVVAAGVSTLSTLRNNANPAPDIRAPSEAPSAPAAAPAPAAPTSEAAPAGTAAPDQATPPQPPASGSSQTEDQAPLTTGSVAGASRPLTATPPGTTVSPTGWQSAAARPGESPQTLPPALRAAAESGNPVAAFDLATRFLEGRGVAISATEAARWYQRAADAGLAPAQYRLGSLYEKGTGVIRDLNRARTLYERAAEAGNGKAMHNLAVIFAQGAQGDRPDYRNAAIWFRNAANHGVTDSQFNLGILYARGLGVDQSLAESYKWFALAANGGDQDAAKKRDEVAGRLDAQTMVAARLAVQTFTARPEPEAAVRVALPADGWGGTAAQTPPRRAQATQR